MSGTILLADDSLTIQKVIELTFAETEYEVIAVSSGEDLLHKLPECRPDLIICDVIMPGKDGYEVCQQIKSNPDTLHIPVILLTGTFEPFDRDRALAAGCSEIITKPFEARKLVETVEKLLKEAGGGSQSVHQEAPEPMGYEGQVTPPPIMPPSPAGDGTDGLDFTTTGFDEMVEAGRAEEAFVAPPPEDGLDFDAAAPAVDGASTAPVAAPFADYDEAPAAAFAASDQTELGEHELDHGSPQPDDDVFAPPLPDEEPAAPADEAAPEWADEAPPDWAEDQALADVQGEETMVLPIPELPEDDAWDEAAFDAAEAAAAPAVEAPAETPEPWGGEAEDGDADLWEQPPDDGTSPWDAAPEEIEHAEAPAPAEEPAAWDQAPGDEPPAWDEPPEQLVEAELAASPEPEEDLWHDAPAAEPAEAEPEAWGEVADEEPQPWDEAATEVDAAGAPREDVIDSDAEAAEPWREEVDAEAELRPQDETTADIELPEDAEPTPDEAPMPWSEDEAASDEGVFDAAEEAVESLEEVAADSGHEAESFPAEEPSAPSPWEEEPPVSADEGWDAAEEAAEAEEPLAIAEPEETEEPVPDAGPESWPDTAEEEPSPAAFDEPEGEEPEAGADVDVEPAPELPDMVEEVIAAAAAVTAAEVEETVAAVMPEPAVVEHQLTPTPPAAPAGVLSDADVERIARRVLELAQETIERIAWEVIPDMAEIVVRERIRQLETEVEAEFDENRPH